MTKKESSYQLFNSSGCLTFLGIKNFLDGSLNDIDKREADKHLSQCDLCDAARQGFEKVQDKTGLENVIREINQNLASHLKQGHINGTVGKSFKHSEPFYFAAAASIVVLIGLLIFLNNPFKTNEYVGQTAYKIQMEKEKIPPMPKTGANKEQILGDKQIEKRQENTKIPKKATEQSEKRQAVLSKGKGNQKDQPIQLNREELKSGDSSFEAFRISEQEQDNTESMNIPGEFLDIAGIQPIEYYLSEVIVNDKNQSNLSLPNERLKKSLLNLKKKTMLAEGNEVKDKLSNSTHFFSMVETMPEFPGGYLGLNEYLANHLNLPEAAREQNIQGRVVISFVINVDGKITNVRKIHGIGGGCDEEALRVINSMPVWKPAIQNGQAVPVMFTLPIYFRML